MFSPTEKPAMLQHFRRGAKMVPKGFTLAELLIVLYVLGVIATFTIPKVLSAQQDAKRKAIMRDTLASVASLTQEAVITGAIQGESTREYFRRKLNYVKECPTDPYAEGCWGGSSGAGSSPSAFLLHNGAAISSLNFAAGTHAETIAIDWNGPESNQSSNDILWVTVCFGPEACDGSGTYEIVGDGPKGPGAVGPYNADAITIYEEIFE